MPPYLKTQYVRGLEQSPQPYDRAEQLLEKVPDRPYTQVPRQKREEAFAAIDAVGEFLHGQDPEAMHQETLELLEEKKQVFKH
ncbi:MAG: hypothetical protein ABEJ07_03240 [Candidatus Nanohaloarchaea archaeon]